MFLSNSDDHRMAEGLQHKSHSLEDPRLTRKKIGWSKTPNSEVGGDLSGCQEVHGGAAGDDDVALRRRHDVHGLHGDVCELHNWLGLNGKSKSCLYFLVVEMIGTIARLVVGNGAVVVAGEFEVVDDPASFPVVEHLMEVEYWSQILMELLEILPFLHDDVY